MKRKLPLPLPVLLGIIVLLAFLPWVLLTGKSERDARLAIESVAGFRSPDFPVRFRKEMKWDSLGLLGRGAKAGFWKWTPEGMELVDAGRAYFTDTEEAISSIVGAGRREVADIEEFKDQDGRREVLFLWRWVEITPPAAALLSDPPQAGRVYPGRAVLIEQDGGWKAELVETPHFDKPLALLMDESREIRR